MDLKDAFQASAESRGKHRRSPIIERSDMPRAKRIVVKVGSSSLTSIENSLDELAIATISDVLAKKKKSTPLSSWSLCPRGLLLPAWLRWAYRAVLKIWQPSRRRHPSVSPCS